MSFFSVFVQLANPPSAHADFHSPISQQSMVNQEKRLVVAIAVTLATRSRCGIGPTQNESKSSEPCQLTKIIFRDTKENSCNFLIASTHHGCQLFHLHSALLKGLEKRKLSLTQQRGHLLSKTTAGLVTLPFF